jgi:8-oxo-dGTP pyrophosphatase MutT (NUDIX family)
VNAAGTEILLTHHKKLNRWLQLGGHADGDTDVLAVALREAREESGLDGIEIFSREIFDIDIHRIPPRGKDPEHDHYDVRYVFRQLGRDAYTVSEESHDLAWVEIDGLERYTEEVSMLRMAEKWRLCLAERDTKSGM